MAYQAEIKADSISPDGCRLTTFEATYPRLVHSEFMTHRMFSRNSASTRAIPVANQLKNVLTNPFIPEKFGVNKGGMQAAEYLKGIKYDQAVEIWLTGRDRAVTTALELILGREIMADLFSYDPLRGYVNVEALLAKFEELEKMLPKSGDTIDLYDTTMLNAHKQLAGRGLETYAYHTTVMTLTEIENFMALRDHPDAQGEIATLARLMREAYEASEPAFVDYGEWHVPYVDEGEFVTWDNAVKASAARSGSVSYARQNVKRTLEDEIKRYSDYANNHHMSPLEHQATPFTKEEQNLRHIARREIMANSRSSGIDDLTLAQMTEGLSFNGNFRGWRQHRKQIKHENNFGILEAA